MIPEPMASLSTGHLSPEERAVMHPGFPVPCKMERDEGWLVWVPSDPEDLRETVQELEEGQWPTLLACIELAHYRGFQWLLFDIDVDPSEDIPTYS